MGGAVSRGAKVADGGSKNKDSVVLQLRDNQLDEFRECFNAFDKDGGGSIDATELESLMKSLGQEPTGQELEKMVALADADGSGDIDFIEFATLIAHKMKDDENKSNKEEQILQAFAVFDADGSGSIDASEMRRMMLNLGEEMSIEQVDDILAHFDENGDGQISPEEFTNALLNEKLLGTEAMAAGPSAAGLAIGGNALS